MPIAVACPHCDWKGKVKGELAGKKGKCPTCGELIPIPQLPTKGAPPPIRGSKKPVDDDPDIIDDADIVDDAEVVDDRPKPKSKSSGGRSVSSALGSVGKGRKKNDEEDERPSRSKRRAVDDEDDDRPSKKRSRFVDDDEEERPSRSKRRAVDDEDDEEPRPRRKGKRRRQQQSGNTQRVTQIIGGVLGILLGVGLLAFYYFVGGRRFPFWAIIIIVLGVISIGQAMMSSNDE